MVVIVCGGRAVLPSAETFEGWPAVTGLMPESY